MESFSYYANSKRDTPHGFYAGNVASDEYPLVVNCAGRFKTEFPFTTDVPSGRKDFYLMYVTRGTLEVLVNDLSFNVSDGDVVLFAPDTGYKYTYRNGAHLDYLWVHFTGSYAERFIRECELYPLPFHKNASDNVKISERFEKIFQVFEEKNKFESLELSSSLERLLLTIAKTVSENSQIPRALERSIRHIHTDYNKKISIPDLAAIENLSNSRYIALFKQQMGMSPMTYIIKMRMSAAAELLRDTDLTVKQIGILVGYHDPHFFSKLFKKHMGISPKEYK